MKVLCLFLAIVFGQHLAFEAFICDTQYRGVKKFDSLKIKTCDHGEDWYEKEDDVYIQVIQSKIEDEIMVTTCEVTESIDVGWCGFDSLLYGLTERVLTEKPVVLTPEQCRKLVAEKLLTYRNQEYPVTNLDSFSDDIPLFGTTRDKNGYCSKAGEFKIEGRQFDDNWVRAIIKGSVTRRLMKYNPRENSLHFKEGNAEAENVPLRQERFHGTLASSYWDGKRSTCLEKHQQVYSGPAKLFHSSNKDLRDYLVVNDDSEDKRFALELQGDKDVCGSSLYRTNVDGTFVTYHRNKFLTEIDIERDVDRLDNLLGLLTLNVFQRTSSVTSAIQSVAKNSCLNSRDLLVNKIELLKSHPEAGSLDIFDKGFAAAVFGSGVFVWKCDSIEVQFNDDLEDVSEDIPVVYRSLEGERKTGFVDQKSFILKDNSKMFPKNSIANPMYFVENTWFCKKDKIRPCTTPKKFSINTDVMRKSIGDLYKSTATEGGFSSRATREAEAIQTTYHLQQDTADILWGISRKVLSQDVEGLGDTVKIEDYTDSLWTQLSKSVIEHPLAAQSLFITSVIFLSILGYSLWTCRNWSEGKDFRKELPEGHRFSKLNYLWGAVDHNKFQLNMTDTKISILKQEHAAIDEDLKEIEALILNLDPNYEKLPPFIA